MDQNDHLNRLTRAAVEKLQPLPSQSSDIPNQVYVIKHTEEAEIEASGMEVNTKIWFKSPPLTLQTIHRIRALKLFTESHDQGFVSDETQGNWSWFELVILENESATTPKKDQDGNELVSMSHVNKIRSNEFEWLQGETFDKKRRLLKSLEEGNVIAVRLCACFARWAVHARNGNLVIDISGDNDPVPIIPIPIEDGVIPHRRNVKTWYDEAQTSTATALELSLFIQAMTKFQALPPKDQLSYFRIAGIHSYPSNVPWNMNKEPIPYDDPNMAKRMKNGEGGDYCPHNKFVFPTWHRAYLMLFERRVSDLMLEEAKTRGDVWVKAAKRWRLPYWDWAVESKLPELLRNDSISIIVAWDGVSLPKFDVVTNPMYSFRMPGGKPMGDPSYGDYRIDGNEDGPWDLCIGTSRHAISYYDEKRCWVQGRSDNEKVQKALEGPNVRVKTSKELLTLKDAVFRVLTHKYNHKYEHFASTKHEPKENPDATGYLSLESIHNSVHNFIGGNNVSAGCGHMSSVPVAAFDPVFWLHHCNIDRILHLWQCFNPQRWFIISDKVYDHDGPRTDLTPFHSSDVITDFYNSDKVRNVDNLNYTYDDMDHINEDGEISQPKVHQYINDLYGPGHKAFLSPSKDVDPIINVIYDRYAFNGLSYAIHFFLGSIQRKVPYQEQPSLVGSIYTFSAPFNGPMGSSGCSNCREQESANVLSHAQIPLTRSVPIEEREDPEKAMEYFNRELRWVAVFDTGAKIPRKAMRDLSFKILLGKNYLGDGIAELPTFGEYEPQEFDWNKAEL
ncbi:Monophenol monooxygenase [Trichoderma chlorosporum]